MESKSNVLKFPTKSKVDWALELAARGVRILPLHHTHPNAVCTCKDGVACKSPGKHPKMTDWQTQATTDEKIIGQWFKQDPAMNYGCMAGAETFMVDLDLKHGANGYTTLSKLLGISRDDIERQSFMVRTPSGGAHLYFASDKAYSNTAKTLLGDGIDTRSGNGYVAGPGSALWLPEEFGDGFEEVAYRVINDAPFAAIPAPIQALLCAGKVKAEHADVSAMPGLYDTEHAIETATNWLKSRAPAIQGQGGDAHTFATAAFVVRDFNLSEDTALRLMLEHWNDRCDPPWDPEELAVKVHNAFAYGKNQIGSKAAGLMEFVDHLDNENSQLPADLHEAANDNQKPKGKHRFELSPVSKARTVALDFIIEDLIPSGMRGLFYGGEQSLKTTALVKIGVDIAMSSVEYHGNPKVKGIEYRVKRHGAVVYVAAEDAPGVNARAREAILDRDPNCDPEKVPFYVLEAAFKITNQEDVNDLIAAIESKLAATGETLALVALDTTVFVLDAHLPEDKSETVTLAYEGADRIIKHFNRRPSVIFVHHTGKDTSKGARGSSNWPASSEFRYLFSPRGESKALDGHRTVKFPTSAVATNEKMKNMPKQQPVNYASRRVVFNAEKVDADGRVTKVKASTLLLDVVPYEEARAVAGTLSDLDIMKLVIDYLEEGIILPLATIVGMADSRSLLTGSSEPSNRIDAFRKRVKRTLDNARKADAPEDATRFNNLLAPYMRANDTGKKTKDGLPVYDYSFIGQGRKLKLWDKYEKTMSDRLAAAQEAERAALEDMGDSDFGSFEDVA